MNLSDITLGEFNLSDILILTALLLLIIILIMEITTKVKVKKMKENYDVFLSGKDAKSLEEILIKKFKLLELLDESVKDIYTQIKGIDRNLLLTFQKMGLVKYDAFNEKSGQMSFVLVLLTKENNGIMMNCMHNYKDGCYTYVKRIEKGVSRIELSDEEKEALDQAMGVRELD